MEDFLAYLDPPPPLYTPSEPLPPAYTLPTPTTSTSNTEPDVTEPEITASVTEPAIHIEPVPLDTFLTLELLTRLVRCIKVTLKIIRSDGDGQEWYEEILEVSGVLEPYLDRVTTTEETKEEVKELVLLTRQCASWIWEYGKREEMFVRMRRLGLGSGEEQNRIKKELEAVDKRLLGKDFLGKLCSPEEAHSLNQRNHFTWIKNIDRYLHDLIWILPTLNQGHPLQPAMVNMLKASFDVETEDAFFEAMRKPSFADLRCRVMQSLRYPSRNSRFEAISEPCPGTCQWIFNAPISNARGDTFSTWIKSSIRCHHRRQQLCWISGDPGTGKSVLMKHLVTEAYRNPSLLKEQDDQVDPIVVSHFFDDDGDPMHRTTQGMKLHLVLQIFEQDPVILDELFFHDLMEITKYRNLSKTSAQWEDYATTALFQRAQEYATNGKRKLFIFLDGPSGFGMRYVHRRTEDNEPQAFLRFLKHYQDDVYENIKFIVAARPEGTFHNQRWPVTIRLDPSLVRHDIKTLCYHTLTNLRFSERHSLSRQVIRECSGSFTEALDALDQIKRQTTDPSSSVDLPPSLTRSEILYSSLFTRFYTSHSKLEIQSLSRILYLLLTDYSHTLTSLRSNRPLSLLQLTLCIQDSLIHNCLIQGSLEGPPDIRSMCKPVRKEIEERLYPFVTLREMEHPPIPLDRADKIDCRVPVQEAAMKVCFLQPSLAEFLTGTEQGRELMRVDEANPPHLAETGARREWVRSALIGGVGGTDEEVRRGELVRDRLKLLLRAGMFEEIVLWRATAKNVERMASELGRVYREYVRFAERSTVLGYLREEEVFPESWVVKFASGK